MTSPPRLLLEAIRSEAGLRELLRAPADRQAQAYRLAEVERVLPVIGAGLVRAGLVPPLPESMVGYLDQADRIADLPTAAVAAYQANQGRTERLRRQLAQLGGWLDEAGIRWVPLKGAAMLADGVWPDVAERVMTDLDVLILDPGQVETAAGLLSDHGLRLPPPRLRPQRRGLVDRHQLPALVRDDWVGSVEVHRSFVGDEFADLFPTDQVLAGVVDTPHGSRLAAGDLALHTIVHAQISDWGYRTSSLSLRAVLDLRHLVAADPGVGEAALARTRSPRVRRAVRAHLVAAAALGDPGTVRTGGPRSGATARLWWRSAMLANRTARRHQWWRHLVLMPVFLRRDRMRARAGRDLGSWELAGFAVRSTRDRARGFLQETRRLRGSGP